MNRLSPVGEEELTLAREGGHSERAALNRRFSSGYDKGEYEGLVALKTAAEKGDKNARDQWDTLCAWTKVIKKNAKDTRLPEIYRKSQQTLLNNLRAMNLFPGLADMYETLGNSSIGDRSSNALAQQIAMAPVVNAITSPSTYAADPFSDYTPIDFVVDIASMLNPFKSSDEDKARKRDYQRAFQYVKKVMASEPKPNPTDLDYALVYTTNRKPDGTVFLLDNDGHITPAFDQDKSEACRDLKYDFNIRNYSKSRDWNNGIVGVRNYIIDQAKKGDRKAKSFYARMIKAGWRPANKNETVKLFS